MYIYIYTYIPGYGRLSEVFDLCVRNSFENQKPPVQQVLPELLGESLPRQSGTAVERKTFIRETVYRIGRMISGRFRGETLSDRSAGAVHVYGRDNNLRARVDRSPADVGLWVVVDFSTEPDRSPVIDERFAGYVSVCR